jgi:uncharacterized protein YegJ (DUF2314 family)
MSARPLNYPRFIRTLTAAAVFALGTFHSWLGIRGFPDWQALVHLGLGVPAVPVSFALFRRLPWAQLPATLVLSAMLVHASWSLAANRTSLWSALTIPALLLLLWDVRNHFTPERIASEFDGSEDDGRPLISLVLLLRKPRHLDATLTARYCEAAWGGTFDVIRDSPGTETSSGPNHDPKQPLNGQFVAGTPPMLVVGAANRLHLVHCTDQPYFDDPSGLANRAGDLRIRRVLEENRGWIAVDLVRRTGEEIDPSEHYPRLARLIAELAGPDCQAIYQPAEGHFNHWDESLEAKLRDGDLTGVFDEITSPAVVEVSDEDPRMIEASRQARARWDEFVQAFRSGNASSCAVKAPVRSGDRTEFIWVTVDAITDQEIRGRLGNDPVDLGDLRLDSEVSVPVDSVEDWVFMRDDQPTGLFSIKALSDIQDERRQRP